MKQSHNSTTKKLAASKAAPPQAAADRLLADVRALIGAARQQVTQVVNAGLITLYWHFGSRIRQTVLGEERAAYGEQIVDSLRTQFPWPHFRELIARPSKSPPLRKKCS